MANIKSQIKRNRQNDKRRLRNRVYRGEARTAIKDARAIIETGDAEGSKKSVIAAMSTLDKAAQQGVLHKNNAARRKSRLMKALAKMEPVEAAPVVETAAEVETPKPAATRKRATKAEPKEAKVAPKEKKTAAKKPAEKKPVEKKPAEKKPATARKKTSAK